MYSMGAQTDEHRSNPSTGSEAVTQIILSREQAAEALSLSLSTFEDGVRKGLYPRPRQISPNRVGWLRKELEDAGAAGSVAR